MIAGTGALVVISAVAFGFLLRSRRDIFYIGTTVPVADPDRRLSLERERLAVKVEPVRLWLLFVPTFLALAFLVAAAANGMVWKFSLLDRIFSIAGSEGYFSIMILRVLLFYLRRRPLPVA